MIRSLAILLASLWIAGPTVAAEPQAANTSERPGLRCISRTMFPVPKDSAAIPISGSDFETDGKTPTGWAIGGKIVTAPDAPQGKSYVRMLAKKGAILRTPEVFVSQSGRPYFLSFWLKSPADHWAALDFGSDETMRTSGAQYPGIPSTGDQWRRVGYYIWLSAQAKSIRFQLQPHEDGAEGQTICVDDVQLRTASEAEMSAAYEAERSLLPPYDVTPRPDDGKNLALSVAKWEGRAGLPGKPFVIWAVGSSWTNFQGDGYPLIRIIRDRFPKAPTIIYKRHAGSGTPWDYARGWIRQFVMAEQPDLVFTYTNGTPEGLDALLAEVRRHTTADIIVPSLHFFQRTKVTPDEVEKGVVPWQEIRDICRKHQAEFVENRRELADYLKRSGLEPSALVCDSVHQNGHGRLRIWDSICHHIAKPAAFNYSPESRERRIAVAPPTATATEQVRLSGNWATADGVIRARAKDARLTVTFTGNRIDLVGRKAPGGGSLHVVIDGVPADRAPAFFTTFIQPKPKQWPRALKGPGPGDVAPHAVDLRGQIVPQTWTITMSDDTGGYRLDGSITGADGTGNVAEDFLSKSGQIGIEAKLWRHGRTARKGSPVIYGNGAGDTFSFDVYRSCVGQVGFKADKAAAFSQPLVQNLSNGRHTLELTYDGDGEVAIDGLYVFQPPLADGR